MKRLIAGVLTVSVLAACLTGDPPGYRAFLAEERATFDTFDRPGVFAAASRFTSLAWTWSVLQFELHSRYGEPGRWAIRNTSGDNYEITSVRWAWSPDCPAVEDVLLGMEAIEMPVINAPSVGWESQSDRIVVQGDGSGYRLKVRSLQLRAADAATDEALRLSWRDLELVGDDSSSLAEWFDASLEALEPCWTQEAPPSD